ncbi:DUF1285 domain-containing protein [Shewanella khirikhana]|uniref:DUF1285 domain-containing protein n=1 Tax=Shewanella khirikhana TaxID=1965282 RepID=UPI0030CEE5BD
MNSKDNENPEQVSAALSSLKGSRPQTVPALCSEQPLFSIDTHGQWQYLGEALPQKFARLFMSVLRRDGEHWALVTPVERVRVAVAHTPVVIVDFESAEGGYRLISTLGHEYLVSASDIRLAEDGVLIALDKGLNASMSRACFYRFAEILIED